MADVAATGKHQQRHHQQRHLFRCLHGIAPQPAVQRGSSITSTSTFPARCGGKIVQIGPVKESSAQTPCHIPAVDISKLLRTD